MNEIELILLLLVVVAALTPVARALRVPYPVLLVLCGLALAVIPEVPDIELTPELVLVLFLPPLVYRAAFTSSIRDFRVALRPILSLAVGLVLATTVVVAVVIHWLIPDLGWPLSFALGAIVSPPDAVAAAAVFRGLGVPRHVVTLLEGESLINDATALVSYRFAIGAVAVAFSASDAAMSFVVVAVGGVLVGLVVAFLVGQLQRRISDPAVAITLSLLTPFAAYLPSETLGVSGVLAAVVCGLYLGWFSSYYQQSDTRLRSRAVWDMLEFILNGLVFILIGLQLSMILPTLMQNSMVSLIEQGLILSLTVIVLRLIWVFADSLLGGWIARLRGRVITKPHKWGQVFVVSWAGMRGVVSLAVVLSLPEDTPYRNVLIFLTFFVILATLVGQGLTLPVLIRVLKIGVDGSEAQQMELGARRTATEAALARIEQLRSEWPGHLPLIDTLQVQYDHRNSHLVAETDGAQETLAESEQELLEHHIIRRSVLSAERGALLDLRARGELDDEVWRIIERDLDLEELRMDA